MPFFATKCSPQQEIEVYQSNLHMIIWKVSLRTFRKWYCLLCCYDFLMRRYYFLKECSENFQNHICKLLHQTAKGSKKLQKMYFFGQFKDHNVRKKTWKLDKWLHFFIYFSALTVCGIHLFLWKWSKFMFMWSPLWSILVCKIPQFWAKATDLDSLLYFSRE